MKTLLALALVAVMASGALAQTEMNEVGFWMDSGDGTYYNVVAPEPFVWYDLVTTVHNPSVDSIGGYELTLGFPHGAPEIISFSTDLLGGLDVNDLPDVFVVDFGTPVPSADFTVIQRHTLLLVQAFVAPIEVTLGPVPNPSIPGANGPVIADGTDPSLLIECGYITGQPHVFTFTGYPWIWDVIAVESSTLTGVKALFN
jgi:hypothetical protein